jgi:hypothetical protein
LCEELERDGGRSGEGERGGRRDLRTLAVTGKVDIVPMVEANGSKPISPLSVAAEPHCVSIKELQLGRRSFNSPPEDSFCSAYGQVLACGRLRGASIHRAK